MGHEFVGIRADTGQWCGQPTRYLRTCDVAGPASKLVSHAPLIGHRSGGFAEQVAVAISSNPRASIGHVAMSAVLIEPLAKRGTSALERAKSSSHIGIIGGGAIGLMTAIVACTTGPQM